MTDKEVLNKAIEIAMDNGYKEPFMYGMCSDFSLDKFQVFKLCFSHDFAKAFWGEKHSGHQNLVRKGIGNYITSPINDWQHHLQQMIIEENPINYLRKFIEDGKQK